jgi:hypothetical protein
MLAKHKVTKPREETVPFGMKPLKGDPTTGDLPVAAPQEATRRRASVPPSAGTRPPIAAPPVRRNDAVVAPSAPVGAHAGGTQRAGVAVSRSVRVVAGVPVAAPPRPGTKAPTGSHAAAPVAAAPAHAVVQAPAHGHPPAAASGVLAPPAAHVHPSRPHEAARVDLDALLLRYLMEDLEGGG